VQALGGFLSAALHVVEERAVQGLEHQRDARRARTRRAAAIARREAGANRCDEQNGRNGTAEAAPCKKAGSYRSCHVFFSFKSVSTSTATTITSPMTSCWRNDDTPSRFNPFRNTPIVS